MLLRAGELVLQLTSINAVLAIQSRMALGNNPPSTEIDRLTVGS